MIDRFVHGRVANTNHSLMVSVAAAVVFLQQEVLSELRGQRRMDTSDVPCFGVAEKQPGNLHLRVIRGDLTRCDQDC